MKVKTPILQINIKTNHVKTTLPITPTKFAGWIRRVAKEVLRSEGVELPIVYLKDASGVTIQRFLDAISPKSLRTMYIALALHPLNQSFGFSVATMSALTFLPQNLRVIADKIMLPARIRFIMKTPQYKVVRYTQGIRDDINLTTTSNPHEVVLLTNVNIDLTIKLKPLPFDLIQIPEGLPAIPTNWVGKKYIDAYNDLLDKIPRYLNTISPFGGRKFHEIQISLRKSEEEVDVTSNPPDIRPLVEYVAQRWRQDYRSYLSQLSQIVK